MTLNETATVRGKKDCRWAVDPMKAIGWFSQAILGQGQLNLVHLFQPD